jgi:hypothetical protein
LYSTEYGSDSQKVKKYQKEGGKKIIKIVKKSKITKKGVVKKIIKIVKKSKSKYPNKGSMTG